MIYFVTAIDTDSGKTLVSAILCEALGADYWKPVQAGTPRDADFIKEMVPSAQIFPETHLLRTPASPHAAAKLDGINISLEDFNVPHTRRPLVVEGAGGCLVPLNDNDFVIDLAARFQATVVLVADLYLGSINHTFLTWEALQKRKLPVKGIIFNGDANAESERIILRHTNLPCLLRIAREPRADRAVVQKYASILKQNLP